MKFAFILFITFFSSFSQAQLDLNAGTQLRSYPSLGGEGFIESGYNLVWWGSGPGDDKKNITYGLIRPAIRAASSVVINQYDLKLEFYPISIFGIVKGQSNIVSTYEGFSFFNCDIARCKGTSKRDYTMYRLALGFGGLVFIGQQMLSENTYSDEDNEDRPVAEFQFATYANADKDTMVKSTILGGIKHSSGIMGILSDKVEFEKSKHDYQMNLLVYTTVSKLTTYVFGLGEFKSTLHPGPGMIAVFQMKTDFFPSKKLF